MPPTRTQLMEFASSLPAWRVRGTEAHGLTWGGQRPPPLPNYLVDRYAFRAFLGDSLGIRLQDRFETAARLLEDTWPSRTRRRLRPVDAAGIPALELDKMIPDYPGLSDWLDSWRSHVHETTAMPTSGKYASPAGLTWGQFFKQSVLYPYYPPAVATPSFINRVSAHQREQILERHGTEGIMGLFVGLLVAHEESHRYQTGDPLLCEIQFASLWCSFLDRTDQWYWERNDETGLSFNVEEPYLRPFGLVERLAPTAFVDTSTVILSWELYAELCWAEWLMDAGALRYRAYLPIARSGILGVSNYASLASLHQRLDSKEITRASRVPIPTESL